MSQLQRFYPGDAAVWMVAIVLAQVTLVMIVALLLERLVKRFGAAARYGVCFSALAGVMVFPLLTIVAHRIELCIVSISVSCDLAAPQESGDASEWEDAKRVRPPDDRLEFDNPQVSPTHGGAFASDPSNWPEAANDVPANLPERTSGPRDVFRTVVAAVMLVWAGGVLWLLVRMLAGLRWIGVLRREAQPLGEHFAMVLARAQQRLDRRPRVVVGVSRRVPVPLAIGLWRPMVLIPEHLLSVLGEAELEDILVHECAHVVRRDLVVGLLQRLLGILYWPHPLVHVLNRRLSQACEEICDNHALRDSDRCRYAGTLLTVAEHVPASAAIGAGLSLLPSYWKLENRVAGLLDKGRNLMTRTNRWLVVSLFTVLVITGIVPAGVRLGEPADAAPDKAPAKTPTDAGKPRREAGNDSQGKPKTGAMKERFRFFADKLGPFRSFSLIQDVVTANEPFDLRGRNGATATGVLRRTADGGLHFKGQVSYAGVSEVLDAPVELSHGRFFAGRLDEGLAVGITLSHVFEHVRPSSGVISKGDEVTVVAGPSLKEQNPFQWQVGAKADNDLTTGKDTWLLFRSKQVRVGCMWIERIDRQDNTFTVTMNRAMWPGAKAEHGTFHQVHGICLGNIAAGTYSVRWNINELAVKDMPFMEFDLRGWLKDTKPANSAESKTSFTVRATQEPAPKNSEILGPKSNVAQENSKDSVKDQAGSLTITLKDKTLPCGVGRTQKNGIWNEPYRYVFHEIPDDLANAQHIFMRQNGGGAVGRWFDTGQVEVSRPCWLYAAVHRPSDAQREIWQKEGWKILPDVLKDLGDPRMQPRPVREYMLMRKRIPAGQVNFDTSATKSEMVIWIFQQ